LRPGRFIWSAFIPALNVEVCEQTKSMKNL
jgi:hypothetical protein